MAVPKKKRYKQIVKSRRSLHKLNVLQKNNIRINFFSNFINVGEIEYTKHFDKNCSYYKNNISKRVCLDCYYTHFVGAYVKFIKKR